MVLQARFCSLKIVFTTQPSVREDISVITGAGQSFSGKGRWTMHDNSQHMISKCVLSHGSLEGRHREIS